MGLIVSQKDIVKIINSSVDNIQVVIDTLATNISKVTKNANVNTLKSSLPIFSQIKALLTNYINTIKLVASSIPVFNFSKIQLWITLRSVKNVVKMIIGFMETLTNEVFSKYDIKLLTKRLDDFKKVIDSLGLIFSTVSKMSTQAILIMSLGRFIPLAIKVIIKIVKSAIKLSEYSITKKNIESIKQLKSVFDALYDIGKTLIKLSAIAIIAVVGAIIGTLFVGAVCVFVLTIGLLARVLKRVTDKTIKDIHRLQTVFRAILFVGFWILAVCLVVPIVLIALVLVLIPFVLVILLTVAILAVVMFFAKKFSTIARNQAIELAINLMLIAAVFIIICLAIYLASLAGEIIMQDGSILKIVAGLIAISVMLGYFILVAKVLNKAEKYLTKMQASMIPLLILLGLMALIMLEIVAFALMGEFIANNLGYIILGFVAVIAVGTMVALLGAVLSWASQYIAPAQSGLLVLVGILGLMALAGLAIVAFALIGQFLDENIGYAVLGFAGISVAALGVAGLGVLLLSMIAGISAGAAGLSPLMVVLAMMGVAGLSIVAFGIIGKYLEDNIGYVLAGFAAITVATLAIIVLGLAMAAAAAPIAVTLVVALVYAAAIGLLLVVARALASFAEVDLKSSQEMIWQNSVLLMLFTAELSLLGIAMTFGLAQVLLILVCALIYAAALGMLLVVCNAIVSFGEINLFAAQAMIWSNIVVLMLVTAELALLGTVMTIGLVPMVLILACAIIYIAAIGLLIVTANVLDAFGNINIIDKLATILGNIAVVMAVGWALTGLGFCMVIMAIGCLLLVAFIGPLLAAISCTAIAVLALEAISNAEIDNETVKANLTSIKTFWTNFKKLIDEFSFKDFLLMASGFILAISITNLVIAIERIAVTLNKISNIKLNDTAIITVVNQIFATINLLRAKIDEMLSGENANSTLFEVPEGGFLAMFKKKKPTTRDKLNNVKRILATITGIASGLNELQKIQLNQAAILNNVESIFTFIDTLATKIDEILTKDIASAFKDNVVKESTWWGGTKEVTKKNASIEKLDNVSKITTVLKEITDTLNKIQKLTLNEQLITDNVTVLFNFINTLATKISTELTTTAFDDKIVEESTWWGGTKEKKEKNDNLTRLDKVSQVISVINSICDALSSIMKVSVNESGINNKLNTVFNLIDTISTKVSENLEGMKVFEDGVEYKWVEGGLFSRGYYKKVVKENTVAKTIGEIEKVVASIGQMMDTIKKLQEFEISGDTKTKIDNNLTEIFNYIKEISLKVNDLLNPSKELITNDATAKATADAINNKSSEYAEKLGSVGEVFKALNDILDSINKIKDIKLKQKDLDTINNNINFLFSAVEFIITTTTDNLDAFGGQTINTENLDNIVNCITTLTDTIQNLNDVKIDGFKTTSKTIIDFLQKVSNINLSADKTNGIATAINSITSLIHANDSKASIAEKRLGFIEKLSTAINALGDTTPEQVNRSKEMIKHQIAYLDKINSVDIGKLKTSTRMIESMAKLSKSIRGNFEGLAESINEDLMPVLEELREIMEKIPEKLDTGFQNTSASISATMVSPTAENVAEQVNRENPNLTADQINEIVNQRLSAHAREQANGLASKIDSLISLLQGTNGSHVVVETL